MQDYWNDPPEEPELPLCPECGSDEISEDVKKWNLSCDNCGHEWDPPEEPDIDPPDDSSEPWPPENEEPPETEDCPHGKKWGDCGACDHEGDLAFDAARERRLFRAERQS